MKRGMGFFRTDARDDPVEETAARADIAADPAPPEQSADEAGYYHDRHGVAEKRELPAEPDCNDDNRREYPLQRVRRATSFNPHFSPEDEVGSGVRPFPAPR